MNKRSHAWLAAICLGGCLVASTAPTIAQAQGKPRVGRGEKIDVSDDVRIAESASNTFRASYEKALSDKEFVNSPANKALKGRVQSLDMSLEKLKSDVGGMRNRHEIKQRIVQVLQWARPVQRTLQDRKRVRVELFDTWQPLRSALNALAVDVKAGRL